MNKTTDLGNKTCVVWFFIITSLFGAIAFITGKNFPDFFPGLFTPALTPIIFPTEQSHLDISGAWNLSFAYNGYTDSNDNFTERTSTETWTINLWQTGNDVNGELVSVNAAYNDSCHKATITGANTGNNLTLFIHFNGDCCPGETSRIDGVIDNDMYFTGTYQPAQAPSGSCTLSTGEVTGIKQ